MSWCANARIFSSIAAAVAVLAWFAGTNHCLLSSLRRPQTMACSMSHCAEHNRESQRPASGPTAMLACCQGLQSANFESAKTRISFNPVQLTSQIYAVFNLVTPEALESVFSTGAYDTGPPTGFFIRVVLRSSLRENAPPLVSQA